MENESQTRNRRSILLNHIIFFAAAILYMAVMVKLQIYCPIRHFTGIPCAGCGMSRALGCLLRLDIRGSLYSNPSLIPCMTALFFLIHKDTRMLSRVNRRLAYLIIGFGFAFTVITYLVRMIFFEIP